MSTNNPTFSQAKHVLTLLDQQDLTSQQVEMLGSGYLSALAQGAKEGTLPPLNEFRVHCGLVVPETPPLLVFDEQHIAAVDISKPHDPKTFWRDTKEAPARYVWGTFTETVVAKAQLIEESGVVKLPYADLLRHTTVREILATSSVGHHDLSRLSKIIASMIAAQPNGEFLKDGLLNDGKGNLFPCGSVLVYVRRDVANQRWVIDDWHPIYEFSVGRRVFSANLIH